MNETLRPNWFVNSGGKIFGPYSMDQMAEFAEQDRLRSTTVVRCGEAGEWMQAAVEPRLGRLFDRDMAPAPPPPAAQLERRKELTASNVVVIGYFRTRSIETFERALSQFGETIAVTPTSWILRTDLAIGILRNDLVKFLGASDRLFIVDGKNGKVTWSNYGPSEEARLRKFVAAGREH
ncbi:MAG: hypothetical protein GC190_19595 [Alphaproteobacteria bacterium]|nr:hypothetical protein [Alphaproteobacteria bacterium]